ncbi:MAG: T9SS type A sorting domain-containing protein [Bacteroidota bacterium]
MQNTVRFLFLLLCIGGSSLLAQDANLVFVNNFPGSIGSPLDLEIKDQNADTVITFVSGISYQSATPGISLPSSMILRYTWLEGGTQTSVFSVNNQVLNPNQNRFAYLYGTQTLRRFSLVGISAQASSSTQIRFYIAQLVSGMPTVDFVLRESDLTLGDNMDYGNITFGGLSQFQVPGGDSATFDITDPFNQNLGICAFRFDENYFAGKSVLYFTSGTANNLQMFAAELDGTVTELTKTAPVMNTSISQELANNTRVYPNPFQDQLQIDLGEMSPSVKISVADLSGRQFKQVEYSFVDQATLDLGELPKGMYILSVETEAGTFFQRVQKG